MATWAETSLCKVADVESEIGEASIVAQVLKADKGTLLQKAIDKSKELIQDELMSRLPDIYAQSGPMLEYALFIDERYRHNDLDTILDKIVNPDVLKLAAVAGAVVVLTRRQIFQVKVAGSTGASSPELLLIEEEKWQKEFKRRIENALQRLKLDLNEDGATSDFERPRTRNSFQRL